jgi:hypothetical protein
MVGEYQTSGLGYADALAKAMKEHPEAHRDYLNRVNKRG